jgi:hypothetical protein
MVGGAGGDGQSPKEQVPAPRRLAHDAPGSSLTHSLEPVGEFSGGGSGDLLGTFLGACWGILWGTCLGILWERLEPTAQHRSRRSGRANRAGFPNVSFQTAWPARLRTCSEEPPGPSPVSPNTRRRPSPPRNGSGRSWAEASPRTLRARPLHFLAGFYHLAKL